MIEPIPQNGTWKFNKDLSEVTWVRNTALLCWPVEWIEKHRILDPVPGLHCTMLYIPDVTGITKEAILDAVRKGDRSEQIGYSLTKVKRVSAFGADNDIPVLELDLDQHWEHHHALKALLDAGIEPDDTFSFKPHVTVPLEVALEPPKKVLLRPLELWYMDEAPVVV